MLRHSSILCIAAAMFVTALPGCSQKLTRPRAAELISKNKDFNDAIKINVPVGNFFFDYRNIDNYYTDLDLPFAALQQSGILSRSESGQHLGWWESEYITVLTPLGKELSKSWGQSSYAFHALDPNEQCWTTRGVGEPCHQIKLVVYAVVLARRAPPEVTGITCAPGGQECGAEFTWKWNPLLDAKYFPGRVDNGEKTGNAAFRLYDDGWRLVEIKI